MNTKERETPFLAKAAIAMLVALISFVCLATSPALAQTSKGTITGTVEDTSGAVVVGATVVATNHETGQSRTATAGPSGGYFMDAMDLGTYTIAVSKDGFQTTTIEHVVVRASVQTSVDAKLKVGSKGETITVESTGTTVQTDNAEISHSIGTVEITSLPFASLNPIELVLTEPGMADVQENGRGTSNGFNFAANGLTPRENNFLLDGQDNNDNSIQGQAFQPSNPNAIREVTILTNSYSAEFGRGGSTVTNVIYKGGSNQFHGSAWELYDGSGLQSVDAANALGGATSVNRFDTHTFGFSAGGPIIKDKLFVFGTSQWFRFYGVAQPATLTLPTPAGAAVLQATGSPNAALLLQYLGNLRGDPNNLVAPSANRTLSNGTVVQFGKVQRPAPPQQNPDTQWNVKVDFSPTQKDTLSVRYLHDVGSLVPDFFNFPASLPGFDTEQGGPSENVVAGYTHVFNSHAVNELRASFGHFDFQFAPTAATLANPLYTLPRFSISGSGLPSFGVSTALPQGRGHQTYQVQDGFSYTAGRHTWKFGADITRLIIRDEVPFNFFGSATYTAGGGVGSLGNFVDNFSGTTGTFATKTFGNPTIRPRADQMAYYMEDTWKTTSNLTLTMGLRYEFQPNPENQLAFPGYDLSQGPFGNLTTPVRVKDDGNNFAPRVGFAYSPQFWKGIFGDNKTVIRAGYGVFYDSLYTNILDNSVASSPNAIAASVNGATGPGAGPRGTPNASSTFALLTPVLTPLATETSMASNIVNPMIQQWNLNVQRELPGKFTMTLAYVGTRGERLLESDTINPFGGFAPGTLTTLPRINPLRGAITVRDNSGDSHYNGGSVKLERQYSHGLLLRGSYTYSKAIDDGSDVFNSFGTADAGNSVAPQNVFSRASARGLSDFDIRHRAVFAYVWNVPGLRNSSNGLINGLGYITRGWEVSGTTSLQSGAPITPFIGGLDTNGDGNTVNGLPFAGTGPKTQVGIDGIFVGGTPGTIYSLNTANDNPKADLVPVTSSQVGYIIAPGLGNVGRNSLVANGSWLQNLAVARHIKIPHLEGHELLLRAEAYNVFNHPNSDNTFGLDSNLLDASNDTVNGTFLNNVFAQQGHRDLRLMLKYNF